MKTEKSPLHIFRDNEIVKAYVNDEWYFAVNDVIAALSGSANPRAYLNNMRRREPELKNYIENNCLLIEMHRPSGKTRRMLAGNARAIMRIAQSVRSSGAESLKRWMAEAGYEQMQASENPRLAQRRIKELYESRGYPKNWIDTRMRGISVRQNLTEEWKRGGVENNEDFALLTHELAVGIFGITPTEHRQVKGLTKKGQSLRDHMTDLELIFTTLGEQVAVELSQRERPNTLEKNLDVVRIGSSAAGKARAETERVLGRSIISGSNFLDRNPDSLIEEAIFGDNSLSPVRDFDPQ